MKVAELYADLGFKVTGQDDLKAFETSMQNIAAAARDAVLALKGLASAKIPRAPAARAAAATGGPTGGRAAGEQSVAAWWREFQAKQKVVNDLMQPIDNPQGKGGNTAVNQGFKSLGKFALGVAGFATLAVVVKKAISSILDMSAASRQATIGMEKFTGQTGVSRQVIRAWELAASKVGVNEDETQTMFKMLAQTQQRVRLGLDQGKARGFGILGVSPFGNPEEVFYRLGERLRRESAAQAVALGQMAGLSEDWVYFLRQQRAQVKNVGATVLNDQQQQSVMELNAAWTEMIFNLSRLKDVLVSDMAPAFETFAKTVSGIAGVLISLGASRQAAANFLIDPKNPLHLIPMAYRAIRGSGGDTKIENNVDVTVNGSDHPKTQARETAQAIQRELNRTYYGRPTPNVFSSQPLEVAP